MFFIYQGRLVNDLSQLPPLGMRALLLGESIFTSTRYQVGRPINFWPDHLQRLALGADQLLGVKGESWEKARGDLLANLGILAQHLCLHAGDNYYLRITGLSTNGERSLLPSGPADLEWLLAGEGPIKNTPPGQLRLQMAMDQRGPMPIKWGNYGPTILAMRQLGENVQDLLFVNGRGEVSECATSNFFAIFPGPEIWTPPVGPGVFNGIYRKNLILGLRQKGYHISEKSFTGAQLASAEEAFTTNCVQGICPVASVVNKQTGRQQDFGRRIVNELREWQNHGTT